MTIRQTLLSRRQACLDQVKALHAPEIVVRQMQAELDAGVEHIVGIELYGHWEVIGSVEMPEATDVMAVVRFDCQLYKSVLMFTLADITRRPVTQMIELFVSF